MPKPATPRGRPPAPAPARSPRPGPARAGKEMRREEVREEPGKLFRVAGLSAVSALFAHDAAQVERLFFEERLKAKTGDFCKAMAAARKPYRMVEADELAKVAGTVLHGGVVALIPPRPVPAFDTEAAKRWAADGQPLLILDGVGNPHNLGAILRTAAFFGLRRVVVSDHPGQALPSESAYRVAEGGFEWVELYRASNLPTVLKRLRDSHRVAGTALGRGRAVVTDPAVLATGERPAAVVLGNEEDGLPPATLAACEDILTLPGTGRIQSLNVAATAAILIHALAKPG
ncbi:TrmH family RNA methyltransferase [Azospirillum brasilense]|uniref:TrmH family RNA methyltransferase n=1 Tax=Azospirillum brasilense TaxID=192 RepID=UPI001ED9E133|nr:RNA methyltransferase [Azospirillum brasilense]UKJ71951.1 RNA methyltransferase [Azospirillum brasilense]